MPDASAPSVFGQQLRYWRKLRGMSQLDLALEADVSPRHVSFLETGRSRPRRPMILKLSAVLDVPLRERNGLLRAAGLPGAYAERDLSQEAMRPFRRVIAFMLERHEPYPAFVIDRGWNVVEANRGARRLLPSMTDLPADGLELFFAPGPMRELMANWDEVVWGGLSLLRRDAVSRGDDEFLRRIEEVQARVAAVSEPPKELPTDLPVLCPILRVGDRTVPTITTIAQFGAAQDVTLEELRVELIFPGDADAERFFEELAGMG